MKEIFENIDIDDVEKKAFFGSFEHTRQPLRVLLGMYKGHYGKLLLSTLLYFIQQSPTVVLPLVTANVINIAADPAAHSLRELIVNGAVMALLTAINVPATYLSTRLRSTANRRVEALLRSSMARKLQQLSITFWKEMESGRVQSKIMRDVENIENLATTLLTTSIAIAISIVSAITITLTKSRTVFFFFLLTIPAAVLLLRIFKKVLRERNSRYRHDVEDATASVNEMVELWPVTKAHALENTAMNRFNRNLFRVADSGHALDCTNGLFGSASWVVFKLFELGCLCFSGCLAFRGRIPIGDVAMYLSYFSTVVSSVSALLNLLPTLSKGFDSVSSVGDIMWAMDVEENRNKKKVERVEGSFSFRDVRFWYPDTEHPILRGFDLEVKAGETVALVGESGSGKSTALNMIIGFYRPNEGQILLDGVDMNELDLNSYRSHIATVPQTSVLFAGSVRDNITYGLEHYTEEQVTEAVRAANLEEVIAKLPDGLDTNVGEHGDKLSGGQRQRIAIARAVIRKASIIIFDEATSALDSASEKLIQDAIEQVSKGRTTFIVAHRLSTIRNADKIAVIKDGVVAEFGTFDELMAKKGEFYRFKALQS